MKRSIGILCAALLVLFAAGCATEVGSHTFIGRNYPAKPRDTKVDVYRDKLPDRPFERVAYLDVRCESQGFMTPNLESDAIPKLIEEARAAGCDGVVEIQERKAQSNWTLETKVKQFTAIGIVYK